MIKIIKPDFVFEDDRGAITQLVHDGFSQFNIVFSKGGVERGKHHHEINREGFYVIDGSFSVMAAKNGLSLKYDFKKGDMFIIEPGTSHTFIFHEDTLLAGFYDIGVELSDGTKDIIAD